MSAPPQSSSSGNENESGEIVVWGDNDSRIRLIQTWFGSTGEPLLKPGRILVGEGVLLKQCRKKLKPRQFFLFNDIIMFANIVVARKRYNKQRILKLSEVSVEAAADERAMQIISPGRSFLVLTATPEEAKEWIFHIRMCIQNLPDKPTTKQQAAAVWVPDSATVYCMVCNVTKFTTFNRRHHCRSCGRVCCGSCSTKKWDLPAISSKPSRVCDLCFEKLAKGVNPGAPTNDAPEKPAAADESTPATVPAAAAAAPTTAPFSKQESIGADFESEDELQSPANEASKAPAQQGKTESDSEDESEAVDKLSDLTLDKTYEAMLNENSRVSLFFTNEENKRVSLVEAN